MTDKSPKKPSAKSTARHSTPGSQHTPHDEPRKEDQNKGLIVDESIINRFADQTMLQALTTIVETTQASDAGRNPVEMAEEMRSLADQTTNAAEYYAKLSLTEKSSERPILSLDLITSLEKMRLHVNSLNQGTSNPSKAG